VTRGKRSLRPYNELTTREKEKKNPLGGKKKNPLEDSYGRPAFCVYLPFLLIFIVLLI